MQRSSRVFFTQELSSSRYRQLYGLILGGSALLYIALNPLYRTGVYNDDAMYVLAAQHALDDKNAPNLAPYRPDFPFPGLPMLLAPFLKIAGPHWSLVEWVSVGVGILSVALLGALLRRWLSPAEALVALALYAFNPVVARFSGVVMPAIFFIAAALGSFLLVERLLKDSSPHLALGLGLVMAWGSFLRPEGFLLVFSAPIALAVNRKWRSLGLSLALPLACWSFYAYELLHQRQAIGTEYGGDVASLLSYWVQHPFSILSFSGEQAGVLFLRTAAAVRLPSTALSSAVAVLVAALGAAAVIRGWRSLWAEKRVDRGILAGMLVFSVLYFAAHVFWRVAIPRYCVAMLPFVFVFLVRGLRDWLFSVTRKPLWVGLVSSVFLLSYAYRNGDAIRETFIAPDPMHAPPWRSLDWIREHTDVSAHVLSTIAPSVSLYASRPAVNLLGADNEEDFLLLLDRKKVDYIMDRPVRALTLDVPDAEKPNLIWSRVRSWIRRHPERYPLVFSDAGEHVWIYRVNPGDPYRRAYALYASAMAALQAGQSDDALRRLRQALALYPLGSAYNALGVICYLSGANLSAAEDAFKKAIAILPDYPVIYLNLASLYHLEERRADSLMSLRRGLAISAANGNQAAFIQNILISQQNHEIDIPDHFLPLKK